MSNCRCWTSKTCVHRENCPIHGEPAAAQSNCRCWNEGQWGRVRREDCPIHGEPAAAQREAERRHRKEILSHLKGIVAIWLTNGNKPVDGGNATRYEFFSGGWLEAADATRDLIQAGFLSAPETDEYNTPNVGRVVPTARGVFEALS